ERSVPPDFAPCSASVECDGPPHPPFPSPLLAQNSWRNKPRGNISCGRREKSWSSHYRSTPSSPRRIPMNCCCAEIPRSRILCPSRPAACRPYNHPPDSIPDRYTEIWFLWDRCHTDGLCLLQTPGCKGPRHSSSASATTARHLGRRGPSAAI